MYSNLHNNCSNVSTYMYLLVIKIYLCIYIASYTSKIYIGSQILILENSCTSRFLPDDIISPSSARSDTAEY